MTDITDQLRRAAETTVEDLRRMGSRGVTIEDTLEWKAAAEIERLRKVAAGPDPEGISTWLMDDDHSFIRIPGSTVQEVKANALAISEKSAGMMLCPITVLARGGKEIRRVGGVVHLRSPHSPWKSALEVWEAEVVADPDIQRLLAVRGDT